MQPANIPKNQNLSVVPITEAEAESCTSIDLFAALQSIPFADVFFFLGCEGLIL